MKTVIAILALAFLAIGPASAESAKSFTPGHHAKGSQAYRDGFEAQGGDRDLQVENKKHKLDAHARVEVVPSLVRRACAVI